MAWQFVLTDLAGTVQGELTQARERTVVLPWMRVPTLTCTIPLWHPLAGTVLTTDTMIKAYRTDPRTSVRTLAFNGPVVSVEEAGSSDGQALAINAAGPFWRLTKRLIPGSLLKTGIAYGSEATPLDLGAIAHMILADVNAAHFTGVVAGTQSNSTSAFVSYVGQIKIAAEAIAELSQGYNSFEYRINATEPTAYANPQGWPRIATIDVGPKSSFAVTRNDAIFEYGTARANVAEYRRSVSRDNLLDSAIISVNGWPDGTNQNLITVSDSATITSRGLFEELVNDAGVMDDALRTLIAQQHVNIRKNPRQIITFTPTVNAKPSPFIDYDVGEFVRCRAVIKGIVRFDAFFRIWGVGFTIDSNGNESVELQLTES